MEHIKLVLEEVKEMLELDPEIRGSIIDSSTATSPSMAYITPKFIIQMFDENHVTISFTINNYQIQKVADLMHIVTLYFYDNIRVIEDHFVDTKKEEIFYGTEAYEKFTEHVHAKNGFTRCPICNRLANKEMWLPEKGYCKVCEIEEIPYLTFH